MKRLLEEYDMLDDICTALEAFQGRIYTCSDILLNERDKISKRLYKTRKLIEVHKENIADLIDYRGGT